MKHKLRRIGGLLAVALLVTAGIVFYYFNFYKYVYYEEKPEGVRLAEVLLAQVRLDPTSADVDEVGIFNGEGVDERLLADLRKKMGKFWSEPGETVVSVGPVFAQNRYKPTFSQEAYVQRVLLVHSADGRTESIWLDYQPAVRRFIPRVWVNGRVWEVPSAPATP